MAPAPSTTVAAVLGLITGSGFYDPPDLTDRTVGEVATPYGPVVVTRGTWRGQPVVFIARHGVDHSIPPHAIDYRANIWALADAKVTGVVATAVSGGINPAMGPGSIVSISDFLDFTSGRHSTFFDGVTRSGFEPHDGTVTHTDMTTPYHPGMRALLRRAADEESVPLIDGAVYCTTNGPRFETPAEIKMMSILGGDLVGMTGCPEVVLAREAGIPYASIGVVSNWAAGIADTELTTADIAHVVEETGDQLYRLIGRVIELYRAGSAA
jgi:5'-methylthioadenosine phosphorylase